MKETPEPSPLALAARRAIEKAGGAAVLRRTTNVSFSAITQWRQRGIPATRAIEIETLTGISRHELRPDVFGASS